MRRKSLLSRFLIWRVRNISDKYFLLILSAVVGVAAGFTALILKTAVFFFKKFLLEDINLSNDGLLLLIYPAIGIAIVVLFKKYFLKDKIKHNITSILHAISRRSSLMRGHKVYSSVFGGIVTAGFGGSIGLESPIISSGAAIGSNIGRLLHLNYKTITLLLACGAAGAIAAIFNTPIAAIVFALEVLMLDLTSFSLIPLLISSVAGTITTKFFYEEEILFEFTLMDQFVPADAPFYILLGVLTGFVSVYFTRVFLSVEKKFEQIKKNYTRVLWGGFLLGVIIFVLPPLYGEGYSVIKAVLANDYDSIIGNSFFTYFKSNTWVFILFFLLLVFFKVVATALTIGSGGIGGIFAPSLFTGAFTGFLFSYIYNLFGFVNKLSVSNFALVGMAGLLGGVLHAPLTGIFLIAEVTSGYELIVPLMLTSTISFLTVKFFEPNSVFTMQLAQKGQLITHHKDKAVLTFMKLASIIETDLKTVHIDATLGELVKIVSKSTRNIFPVVNNDYQLEGLILIENIREIMFTPELYEDTYVRNLMVAAPNCITSKDSMEQVMKKFKDANAWNLPVIDEGKYVGIVSKSKMFSEYRKLLVDISAE